MTSKLGTGANIVIIFVAITQGFGHCGVSPVSTMIAFLTIAGLAWLAQQSNEKERVSVASFSDEEVRQSICFARQDLRLVAYALAAILVMLGIIADRIH